MRLRIVVGIGLLAALAGCGAEETVEVVSPAAPAVTDCGVFVLHQGEQISASAADCFIEATAAGDPATLEVTFPTTEGDPIVQTYRHTGDAKVQVVTDATQDNFGSGKIETQVCTDPARSSFALTFAACQ